jgi:hypothetical protein
MIKFNCLIHKETKNIIDYATWQRGLEKGQSFILGYHGTHIVKEMDKEFYRYTAEEMLFTDDFKIIYDSDFTLEELRVIFRGNQRYNEELMRKILKNINDKEFNKDKYGIEG